MNFFQSKGFFVTILLLYLAFYAYNNQNSGLQNLSSDLVIYQMIMVQEQEPTWDYVPPAYNRENLYLAYPLFYWLNPGLEGGLFGYHALVIFIISATYILSGLVIYRIVRHWGFAALGALLIVIPHNVGFTTIGLSSVGDSRGNVLAFPFYLLLSYYWLVFGIHRPIQNIGLAMLAGILMYIYPIASVLSVGIFSIVGLSLYWRNWRNMLKPFLHFWLVYLLIVTPFFAVYLTNSNAVMTGAHDDLTAEQLAEYSGNIVEHFRDNGFLSTVDLARVKRTLWDTTPLLALFVAGALWLWRTRSSLTEEERRAHQVSIRTVICLLIFLIGIDTLNEFVVARGGAPVFVEHIRSMRLLGFILIAEAVLILSVFYKIYRSRMVVALAALFLVFSPLYFSAPLVRAVVRATIPESIRIRYNLAPIVTEDMRYPGFADTFLAAQWAKNNLPQDVKVFVFFGDQQDFNFKFFSRRNTNLTNKEGSIWVTSGYENSIQWSNERERYNEMVNTATDFRQILEFARELNSTHLLLPRGPFSQLYDESAYNFPVLYANDEYRLLEI